MAEVIQERQWNVLSLAVNGEVFKHSRHDIYFTIPNFISSDLAARCGIDEVTSDAQHINARIEVLKRLKQANKDTEASHKGSAKWQCQRALNIYNETKSVDPSRWAKTTVRHVTQLLWQEPKIINYYAAHKYLMEHPLHFIATENYLKSQTFYVRPSRDVEEIETVQRWIAEHRKDEEGRVSRFVKKANEVLKEHKKSGEINHGPMSQQPANHTWNEEDQVFLRCLLRSLAPTRSIQKDPYSICRSTLIKLLNPQVFAASDAVAFECLKKLGVIAPWQDIFELIPHSNPTGDFYMPDSFMKENEGLAKRTVESKAVAGTVLGPDDLHPLDPLESVRHDFGNMKVFVIDDASAEELDDGISVERIPSEPGRFWLHAHIADPASLLHPRHMLSLRARERGSTLYLGQKTIPLFPKSLVHHPTLGMSLGIRSSSGLGDRTITFSAKVDQEGDILAYKVRAGIVRNVRKVTYSNCDELLGVKPMTKRYPFGQSAPSVPEPSATFTEEEASDLMLLYQLTQQQVKRRFDAGMFMLDNERVNVDCLTLPGEDIQSPCMHGTKYQGFPEMNYYVTSTAATDQGSRLVVSEMMKIASRVASRVALEHDLPLLRRAMDPIIPVSEHALQDILQSRTPNGYISMYKFLGHMVTSPASVYTLQPKRHSGLGIPDGEGYSRATSPLRRFEDLVVHWQLHHLLLGPKAPLKPPFHGAEMEQLCTDVTTLDKTNRKIMRNDMDFHALMFMKRWMERSQRRIEQPLKDPLEGTLTGYRVLPVRRNLSDNQYIAGVILPELGIKAQLVGLDAHFSAQVPLSGQMKVKVKDIQLASNRMALQVMLA